MQSLRHVALSAPLALCLACGSGDEPEAGGIAGTAVVFDLDADTSQSAHFYDFPWPSDLRLNPSGGPDLMALPNPDAVELLDGLARIASDRPGFPVIPVAWFRFDGPLAERDRALVAAAKGSPVLLIDVDPRSPERGELIPTIAPTLAADALYVPDNVLAVASYPGIVLHPDRLYAFVVMRSLGDAAGKPLGVPKHLLKLEQGGTPSAAKGVAAFDLYQPLWQTLGTLGVEKTDVAAATVFTTGDVVQALAALAAKVVEQYDVSITNLHVDPVDGATHLRFCELLGEVTYPEFQKGTPPFNTDGLFELGADGLPVKQRDERAPITITLPNTPMPVGGYPLVIYFHGSGGLSSAAVDMGRGTTPDGEQPVPGTGPAHYLSEHGFATIASALPLNPERLPGATELKYLNFNNLACFRDTFRQGTIEQHLLIEAVEKLVIPPSVVASCPGLSLPSGESDYRLKSDTLYAQGQSMGGMYTNLIGATHPRITAVVPTGAGGFWSKFIPETKLVGNLGVLAGVIMHLPLGTALGPLHPTLHTLETGWEPAEPLVYMPRLARRPLEGHPVRPIYEPIGKDDSYFPTTIYDAIVLGYGHREAGEVIWPELQASLAVQGLDGVLAYPVKADLQSERDAAPYTGVVVQYLADGPWDPHAIYRQLDAVKYQYGCFFETFRDTGVAVVSAPAPFGTPCSK